jgi:hypothetical protein
MTQQAKALIDSQSANPFQNMKKTLADATGATQDVQLTTWIDGDYEWAKVEKGFSNLDEVSKILKNDKGLFNNFSLIRKRGIFQDEFILEAEFAPLNNSTSSRNDSGVDPSAFIQMSFSARLPGKIIETNGLRDINDPNRIVWNMQSKQSVAISARSTTWNWINIFITAGFLLLLGVVAIGGLVYFFYATSQKNKDLQGGQRTENLPIQEAGYIADLGIENLLLEMNAKVLNSVGQIHKRQGGIALVWKDARRQERMIDVKDLEGNQISINDQVHSATKEDTRSGIIGALRYQVKK